MFFWQCISSQVTYEVNKVSKHILSGSKNLLELITTSLDERPSWISKWPPCKDNIFPILWLSGDLGGQYWCQNMFSELDNGFKLITTSLDEPNIMDFKIATLLHQPFKWLRRSISMSKYAFWVEECVKARLNFTAILDFRMAAIWHRNPR